MWKTPKHGYLFFLKFIPEDGLWVQGPVRTPQSKKNLKSSPPHQVDLQIAIKTNKKSAFPMRRCFRLLWKRNLSMSSSFPLVHPWLHRKRPTSYHSVYDTSRFKKDIYNWPVSASHFKNATLRRQEHTRW